MKSCDDGVYTMVSEVIQYLDEWELLGMLTFI